MQTSTLSNPSFGPGNVMATPIRVAQVEELARAARVLARDVAAPPLRPASAANSLLSGVHS